MCIFISKTFLITKVECSINDLYAFNSLRDIKNLIDSINYTFIQYSITLYVQSILYSLLNDI